MTATEPGDERRVCLLAGGGGTLGSAVCASLGPEWDIVATYRRRRPAAVSQYERFVDPLDPAAQLAENARPVHLVQADLTEDGAIDRVVEVALARFGRIDLLVNNAADMTLHPAGVLDGRDALDDADRILSTNVGVPLRLAVTVAQQFWRDRVAENRARRCNVVNVSSLSGSKVYERADHTLYAASKAALNHLTRYLALEFDSIGVRVNAVAPTSFPHRVTTESVVAGIRKLDGADVTGKILAVDEPGPAAR